MPRGFRVDHMASALARLEGDFLLTDPRSFVSLPKLTGHTNGEALPHLILHGKDKCAMRAEIFRRDREAGGGINRCWECGTRVCEFVSDDWTDHVGEWDHINSKSGQRCDCPENGRVTCRKSHRARHVQVEWSKSA